MSKNVFCLSKSRMQAETIVERLKERGITNSDISILFPDKSGKGDLVHEHETKAPEGFVVGSGAGGLIGGALGLLVGMGALAIPGAGPLLAAGPIMAALSGAAIGATTGGLIGALVGLGLPEYVAKKYAGKIKEGNFLLAVHCIDSIDEGRIKEIFKSSGAEEISSVEETKVKHTS